MSLLIGLYVKKALENDSVLSELTAGKIAPVVFPEDENISAPYVYFYRTGLTENVSKDGMWGDSAQVSVDCVGRTYEEMLMLAQAVRDAFRMDFHTRDGNFSDLPFVVSDMTISSGPEGYDPDTCEYTTQINVEFETEWHTEPQDPDKPKNRMLAYTFPFGLAGRK